MDRLRANPTLPLAAGGALLAAVIGYEVAIDASRLVQLSAVAAVLLVALRWPRAAIPLAIPATLLLTPATGGRTEFVIPFALVTSWLVHLLLRRIRIFPLEHGLLLAFAAWLLLAYLVDDAHLETQLSPGRDLLTFLLGLSICGVAISFRPSTTWVLTVIAGAAGVLGLVVLFAPDSGVSARVYALTLNPNSLGLALALGVVASLAGWLSDKRNPLWIAVAALCLVALSPTESRGAVVALVAGIGALTALGRRRWLQAAVAGAVLAILLVPGLTDSLVGLTFGSRTTVQFADSNAVRISAATTALRYAVEHPVFGVGYGQFAALAVRDPLFATYLNTHNDLLRLAAESGLPALVLFIALIWIALGAGGWRQYVPLKVVLITYLVGLQFGNFLSSLAVTTPFWLCLGILLGNAAIHSRERAGGPQRSSAPVASPAPGWAGRSS